MILDRWRKQENPRRHREKPPRPRDPTHDLLVEATVLTRVLIQRISHVFCIEVHSKAKGNRWTLSSGMNGIMEVADLNKAVNQESMFRPR